MGLRKKYAENARHAQEVLARVVGVLWGFEHRIREIVVSSQGMNPVSSAELWQRERLFLQAARKANPDAFFRAEPVGQDETFPYIGIKGLPENRPHAYLRLYPQDFMVEEVSLQGNVSRITEHPTFQDNEDHRTLWVQMVKANIMHFDALKDLAKGLGITAEAVGHAGIKDAIAVTSQEISLRGVEREDVGLFQHNRVLVYPSRYGNGTMLPGQLKGNRFTLVVRTGEERNIPEITERLNQPFWNFFGPQRFGSRVLSHKLGQAILQGDANKCLRLFFTEVGVHDLPYYRDIRKELGRVYGDWTAMDKICESLPHTFSFEREVLAQLKINPQKTRMALGAIRDQVKFWVHAYGSWLMNETLSDLLQRGGTPPTTIPLPFSSNGPTDIYRARMERDGTLNYRDAFAQYPYLSLNDKTLTTQLRPTDVRVQAIPQGCIVRFSLDKGAYATTCLSHAFRIVEGLPVPSWVMDGQIDSFAELGEPSLAAMLPYIEDEALKRRDLYLNDDEGAEA